MKRWTDTFKKRFKTPPNRILAELNSLRYIIYDTRDRKSPTAYISRIITIIKVCD